MLKKQKAVNSFASFFIKKENTAAPKVRISIVVEVLGSLVRNVDSAIHRTVMF